MPSFCRHNHLVQNCPICAREQHVSLRPVVTGGTRADAAPSPAPSRVASPARPTIGARTRPGVTVRHMARGADDGYHTQLVPGLKSSADAERLALELAWAATRLEVLATDPPGLYAEVAGVGNREERTWLAFLIAYLGPLAGDEPFAEIERVRVAWPPEGPLDLDGVRPGERSSLDTDRAPRTLAAYCSWATRSGSQAAGLTGAEGWTPERRFARAYERVGLPGLERGSRFDLLVTLGRTGVYEMQAATLALGGSDSVTVGAKRVLGIGDPILLERRATDLARACDVPLDALDVGLFNWERGERAMLGMPVGLKADTGRVDAARAALGV